MHKTIITFFCLSVLCSHTVWAVTDCPAPPTKPQKGQVLAVGFGLSAPEARKNALVDLNTQLNVVQVDTQYIQRQQNGQNNQIEANSSITSNGRIRANINQQQIFKCRNGMVAYLLYDHQSLVQRIADIMQNHKQQLSGPDYLLNSTLLAPFRTNYTGRLPIQLVGSEAGMLLQIGNKRIALSADQLSQLLALPQSHKITLSVNSRTTDLLTNQTLNINLISDHPVDLFLCQSNGYCHWLISGTKQSMMLQPRFTNDPQPMFLVALTQDYNADKTLNLFGFDALIRALELAQKSPNHVAITEVKLPGNFQHNTPTS